MKTPTAKKLSKTQKQNLADAATATSAKAALVKKEKAAAAAVETMDIGFRSTDSAPTKGRSVRKFKPGPSKKGEVVADRIITEKASPRAERAAAFKVAQAAARAHAKGCSCGHGSGSHDRYVCGCRGKAKDGSGKPCGCHAFAAAL